MNEYEQLGQTIGFDWDKNNSFKNWIKHRVTTWECEEVFENSPLLLSPDYKHSQDEERLIAFGKTKANRRLLLCYTIRNNRVRVISARPMNKRESEYYEKGN
jgi:uncharacterized DUF497 family protein